MTTPCQACCPVDLLIPNDFDYGTLVYATQGFSFVIDCPVGYYCKPGLFPVTVTIPKSEIPPVNVPPNIGNTGGTIILRGCSGFITGIVTRGSGAGGIAVAIGSMQHGWALMQARCNVIAGLIPLPAGLAVEVGNDQECFSTSSSTCPGGQVQEAVITSCIPPDTFTIELTAPSTEQVQAAKAALNNKAALQAQLAAEAQQICGWFNAGNSYANGCACSPGCGAFGPFSWTWVGGEFFSTVSLADANSKAACSACDELYAQCLASGCPAGSCLTTRNSCGANPCP